MRIKIQHGLNLLVHKINLEHPAVEYARVAKIKVFNTEDPAFNM